MSKIHVYLASPYTIKGYHDGTQEQQNALVGRFMDVAEVTAQLQMELFDTHIFFAPIVHSHPIAQFMGPEWNTYEVWVEGIDEHIIKDSMNELWVCCLDGWTESKGVRREMELAHSLGMPIKLVDPKSLEIRELEEVMRIESATIAG